MSLSLFISYAVEDEQHNQRVKNFTNELRLKGMEVYLFDDMPYGDRFAKFMEKIDDVDFTLLICTPKYCEKANARVAGVGRENDIMAGSIIIPANDRKFIPVLFSGDWDSSIPRWARGKKGVDYRNSSMQELNKLIKYLQDYEEDKECDVLEADGLKKKNTSLSRNKKMLKITLADGSVAIVELLLPFKFNDTGKEYVIYTDPQSEPGQDGSVIIYTSLVKRNSKGEVTLHSVSDEDWERVAELLRELSYE